MAVADVGHEQHAVAVGGLGGLATVGVEGGLGLGGLGSLGTEALEGLLVRVHEDLALGAVHHHGVAVAADGAGVGHGEDRGNLQGAGDDGGVGGAAAGLGDDAGHVLLVDVRRHGRGEVVHHDDGAGRQHGEVHDLLAQQVGQKAHADVLHVGGALAHHGVVHAGEHAVEHVADLVHGLLGAHAGVDAVVDLVDHERVAGHVDVADHDLRLLLAHRDRHAVGLGLGAVAEGLEGAVVTLALGGGVVMGRGGVAEVRLNGHLGLADTDAVGAVDSLEHWCLLLAAPGRLSLG